MTARVGRNADMSEAGYLKCSCRNCQGHIEFPAEAAGSQVVCPHCGAETVLFIPTVTKVEASAPTVVTTPEPVKSPWEEIEEKAIRCPSCGAKTAATAKKCPNCGAAMKRSKMQLAFRIVGSLIIVGLLIALPFTYLKKGPMGRGGGPTGPDLQVFPHAMIKEPGGNLMYVTGKLANNSDNRYLAVKVDFELVDKNGASLGTVSDYTPFLEPHRTWTYKAMVIDPDAVNAKFVNMSAERHIEDPKVIEERKAAEKKKAAEEKEKKAKKDKK
jgi:predicted RNA-binding Zn-ribbon protein involved in translation (DUF1610 family)